MNILTRLTWRYFRENPVRTLATFLGVILASAMITGVTTMFVSARHFTLDLIKANKGTWQLSFQDVDSAELESLSANKLVGTLSLSQPLGYSPLNKPSNPYTPYAYILGMDQKLPELLSMHVVAGRLPRNSGELAVSEDLALEPHSNFKVGQEVTLDIGRRLRGGHALDQSNPYLPDEDLKLKAENGEIADAEQETFSPISAKTYKITGVITCGTLEEGNAPGYLAVTGLDKDFPAAYTAYVSCRNVSDVQKLEQQYKNQNVQENGELLYYQRIDTLNTFAMTLIGISVILILVIMAGSAALISNAFSISISERIREFGLLSSLGATGSQIRGMVLREVLMLAAGGIPLGILSGILGIWATLKFINFDPSGMFSYADAPQLRVVVSPGGILAAIIISLVTLLISAAVPAAKAAKASPIEAIRQTSQVKTKPVRVSALNYRLFGVPGMVAAKYFKRAKGRYRATIISLTISVVLFITMSSFSELVFGVTGDKLGTEKVDVSFTIRQAEDGKPQEDDILKGLQALPSVREAFYAKPVAHYLYLDKDRIALSPEEIPDTKVGGRQLLPITVYYLSDEAYQAYAAKVLPGNAPAKPDAPAGIFCNVAINQDEARKKYKKEHLFRPDSRDFQADIFTAAPEKGLRFSNLDRSKDGKLLAVYVEKGGKPHEFPADGHAGKPLAIHISAVTDVPPDFRTIKSGFALIMPKSAETLMKDAGYARDGIYFYVKSPDHSKALRETRAYLLSSGTRYSALVDLTARNSSEQSILRLITVMTWGFITLISLIAIVNVFNTMTTNIKLRRRDFAMLKSIGMTPSGFRRMLLFECLRYASKALLFGLPIGLLLALALQRVLNTAYVTAYVFPWGPVLVAAAGVFLSVLITMIYATRKLRKESLAETLSSENA